MANLTELLAPETDRLLAKCRKKLSPRLVLLLKIAGLWTHKRHNRPLGSVLVKEFLRDGIIDLGTLGVRNSGITPSILNKQYYLPLGTATRLKKMAYEASGDCGWYNFLKSCKFDNKDFSDACDLYRDEDWHAKKRMRVSLPERAPEAERQEEGQEAGGEEEDEEEEGEEAGGEEEDEEEGGEEDPKESSKRKETKGPPYIRLIKSGVSYYRVPTANIPRDYYCPLPVTLAQEVVLRNTTCPCPWKTIFNETFPLRGVVVVMAKVRQKNSDGEWMLNEEKKPHWYVTCPQHPDVLIPVPSAQIRYIMELIALSTKYTASSLLHAFKQDVGQTEQDHLATKIYPTDQSDWQVVDNDDLPDYLRDTNKRKRVEID